MPWHRAPHVSGHWWFLSWPSLSWQMWPLFQLTWKQLPSPQQPLLMAGCAFHVMSSVRRIVQCLLHESISGSIFLLARRLHWGDSSTGWEVPNQEQAPLPPRSWVLFTVRGMKTLRQVSPQTHGPGAPDWAHSCPELGTWGILPHLGTITWLGFKLQGLYLAARTWKLRNTLQKKDYEKPDNQLRHEF